MAGIKDKIVTAESLSTFHEHNKNTYATKTSINNIQEKLENAYMLNSSGTAINSGDDLDNYTTAGIYYAVADVASTLTNKPTSVGFKLVVERGYTDDRVFQTVYSGTASSPTYTRKLAGGTWSAWKRPLTNILYSYDYGDSLPTAGIKGRIFFKRVVE